MSGRTVQRFSPETLKMLREAGWFPGRDVSGSLELPADFTLHPAAGRVLAEFGGLRVGLDGPGTAFARTPLVLDPMLALGESEQFSALAAPRGSRLYPLGETADGHSFVAIDELGRVFLIFGSLTFVDESFDAALDTLLRGAKPLRPVDEAGCW